MDQQQAQSIFNGPVYIIANPTGAFPVRLATHWRSLGIDVAFLVRSWGGESILPCGVPILASERFESPQLRASLDDLQSRLDPFEREVCAVESARFDTALGPKEIQDYRPSFTPSMIEAISIANFVRETRPALVFGHETFSYGLATAFCDVCPRVIMPWGSDVYRFAHTTTVAMEMTKYALSNIERIIPTSPVAARMIHERFNAPAERIEAVSWGVDRAAFQRADSARREAICANLGIPASSTIVVNGRRFKPYWGCRQALRMALRHCRDVASVHYFMLGGLGSEQYIDEARREIEDAGLSSRIRILDGHIPDRDVQDLFSVSDISISLLPYNDMRSATILEVAASGAVSIVSDLPEYREMIKAGYAAEVVDVRDDENVYAAITRYSQNPALRAEVAAQNERYIAEHEDHDRQMHVLLDVAMRAAASRIPVTAGGSVARDVTAVLNIAGRAAEQLQAATSQGSPQPTVTPMPSKRGIPFIVTIDVERDSDRNWGAPQPTTFRSVREALPNVFHTLCRRYNVRPTYLVSPEVLSDAPSVQALARLEGCELGSHLHVEDVEGDTGRSRSLMQHECSPEVERAVLQRLTERFRQAFQRQPTSFRAGRFGASEHTAKFLLELGYLVDSSVTPHVVWHTSGGQPQPDFRGVPHAPYHCGLDGNIWRPGLGGLMEVPLTIVPREQGEPAWFRPWYSDIDALISIMNLIASESEEHAMPRPLVMMFHSNELVAGASPYPQSEEDVARYLGTLDSVFKAAQLMGFEPMTLSEYAARYGRFATAKNVPAVPVQSSGGVAVTISPDYVQSVVERHGAQPWFSYVYRERDTRWDEWMPCRWIVSHLSPEAKVLSSGCGIGVNLLWLAERGFRQLAGFDLDPKAIAAGNEISQTHRYPLTLWVDDGITPTTLEPEGYDVIEALNWTHLVDSFSLEEHLLRYKKAMKLGGYFIIDVIDAAYNDVPKNQYLSSDWNKPEAERARSEYRHRFSFEQVSAVAQRCGFAIVQVFAEPQTIPKRVYILKNERPFDKIAPSRGVLRSGVPVKGTSYQYADIGVTIVDRIDDIVEILGLQKPAVLCEPDMDVEENETERNGRKRRDAEVLAILAANSEGNCLDIGTSQGRSAFKLGTNVAPNRKVYTVNILPEQFTGSCDLVTHFLPKEEIGKYFRERGLTNVDQMYADTLTWNMPQELNNLGMVFVDGAHDTHAVYSDSKKAWERLAEGGFIVWHDFSPIDRTRFEWIDASMRGVEQFVREVGVSTPILNLKNSWTGILRKPVQKKRDKQRIELLPSRTEGATEGQLAEYMRGLKYFLVYPDYSESRRQEEEQHAFGLTTLGYDVQPFGIPCPGGWWKFETLDQAWRGKDSVLLEAYEKLASLSPDVVIASGGSMLHPEFVRQLGAYSVFLCADDPESSEVLSQPVAPAFDLCLPNNVACVDLYRQWGCRNVDWMFHILPRDLMLQTLAPEGISTGRDIDIMILCERIFNASDRAQRIEALVKEFPNAFVRGRGWPGGHVSPREHYLRTKIGWNLHNSIGPTNTRTYMLPAMGVFQICDNKEHLGKLFELDKEVVGFDTLQECIEKTRYYLAHDDERCEIAYRGWQRWKRDYTPERWWKRVLSLSAEACYAKLVGARARAAGE